MGMTGSEVITLARTLVDEPDTTALKSSQAIALLNAANLEVYRRIIAVNPDYFLVRANITFPAATESIDLSGASYLNASVFKILGIEVTTSAGGAGVNNYPTKLQPMAFQDRAKYLSAGGWGYVPSGTSYPAHYSLVGANTLYLAPIAASALNLTVFFAPQLTALTSGTIGSTEVLGGLADEFHDCVAYCLAALCESKAKGSSQTAARLWLEAQDRIATSGGKRDSDEPRRVRYKGYR